MNNSIRTIVVSCTFKGNHAGVGGGGINTDFCTDAIVANCLFWGNTDRYGSDQSAQIACSLTASPPPVLQYCTVQGWTGAWGGLFNNGLDPLFADDFGRLGPGSPAIDTGDNSALPPGTTTDIDGNPRFVDDPFSPNNGKGVPPIVDRGAFEFQPVPCAVEDDGDCDGVANKEDNCPALANVDQADFDGDGFGDACDGDVDDDGGFNEDDVCNFSPAGAVVGLDGTLSADADGDCDVDLDDFAALQIQFTGKTLR